MFFYFVNILFNSDTFIIYLQFDIRPLNIFPHLSHRRGKIRLLKNRLQTGNAIFQNKTKRKSKTLLTSFFRKMLLKNIWISIILHVNFLLQL